MRDRILTIVISIATAVAVGLTATDETSAAGPEPGESAAAKRDYTHAQKAEFVRKMKEELVDIRKELDGLSAKVDRSSGAAKADAQARLEVVRRKWAQAKKRLDQAESATESTWEDVKDGIRKSYGELKDSFEKARQWLSDKIAP